MIYDAQHFLRSLIIHHRSGHRQCGFSLVQKLASSLIVYSLVGSPASIRSDKQGAWRGMWEEGDESGFMSVFQQDYYRPATAPIFTLLSVWIFCWLVIETNALICLFTLFWKEWWKDSHVGRGIKVVRTVRMAHVSACALWAMAPTCPYVGAPEAQERG